MKSLICAIILFCSAIIGAAIVGMQSGRLLDEFDDVVNESIRETSDKSGVDNVKEQYQNIKPFLILFIDEDYIKEFEISISDIESAVECDDAETLITSKNRLTLQIKQLKRLSTFSFEAIL